MKKKVLIILGTNIIILAVGFYLGILFYEANTEPVEVIRYEDVNYWEVVDCQIDVYETQLEWQAYSQKLIQHYQDHPVTIEVDKPRFIFVDRVEHRDVFISANATEEELSKAFDAIEYGRWVHNMIATNPYTQNKWTGDTEWNLEWIDNYDLFRELIERAYR
ncbi:hypothetical protein ES703_84305 [subsurface metagenome]